MKKLDIFFDSYKKKRLAVSLIYLFCSLIFVLIHVLLAFDLITSFNYEQAFSLADQWSVQHAFFGRCALLVLAPFLDIKDIMIQMFFSLRIYEVIYFLGSLLFLFTRNKINAIGNIAALLCIILVFGIAYIRMDQAASVDQLITIVRYAGIMTILIFAFNLFFLVIRIIFDIQRYHQCFIN